jgi:nucleotide-binding universal stress UspA family protein
MFNSVLVPIDIAQESSWAFALPETMEIAKAGGRRVIVITVVRDVSAMFERVYLAFQLERMIADARSGLARIVAEVETSNVSVEQEVRFGGIGREILACARDRGVDLIVMASHRPEMRDYLIGPNAAHVARHASCSVLVLRKFRFRDSEPPT